MSCAGKLGLGSEDNISVPSIITSFGSVVIVKISAGCEHRQDDILFNTNIIVISYFHRCSAAISSDGDLYTWGHGDGGRLGHGDCVAYCVPTLVQPLRTMGCR